MTEYQFRGLEFSSSHVPVGTGIVGEDVYGDDDTQKNLWSK
jgi:hypothetical protein